MAVQVKPDRDRRIAQHLTNDLGVHILLGASTCPDRDEARTAVNELDRLQSLLPSRLRCSVRAGRTGRGRYQRGNTDETAATVKQR